MLYNMQITNSLFPGVNPGIFNGGGANTLPGTWMPTHSLWLSGHAPLSAKIRGAAPGAPPLNLPLIWYHEEHTINVASYDLFSNGLNTFFKQGYFTPKTIWTHITFEEIWCKMWLVLGTCFSGHSKTNFVPIFIIFW